MLSPRRSFPLVIAVFGAVACQPGTTTGDNSASDDILAAEDTGHGPSRVPEPPDFERVCWPCSADADCTTVEVSGLCVRYGAAEGAFCGAACKPGSKKPCSIGFVCRGRPHLEGGQLQSVCVPEAEAPCACSPGAVEAGAFTSCAVGPCPGERRCVAVGVLPSCDAPEPGPERCDGLDNDCNGEIDEIFEGLGAVCTAGSAEYGGQCQGTGELVCGADALALSCSASGKPSGERCDDSDPQTEGDACSGGAMSTCVGIPVGCDDDGLSCTKTVLGVAGACATALLAGHCLVDGVCFTAGDLAPSDPCRQCLPEALAEAFSPRECSDGIECTVDTCLPALGCIHEPDHAACDDADACTSDTCVLAVGCQSLGCDDGLACTLDSCVEGSCLFEPQHSECDDGVACTVDVCDPGAGCVSTPDGSLCDDGLGCTEDLCHPGEGCRAVPLPGVCPENEFPLALGKALPGDSFGEVPDGAEIEIVQGPQGGVHVEVALRATLTEAYTKQATVAKIHARSYQPCWSEADGVYLSAAAEVGQYFNKKGLLYKSASGEFLTGFPLWVIFEQNLAVFYEDQYCCVAVEVDAYAPGSKTEIAYSAWVWHRFYCIDLF